VTFLRADFLVLAYPFADLWTVGAQDIGLNDPLDDVERLVPLFMRVQQRLQICRTWATAGGIERAVGCLLEKLDMTGILV